MSSEYKIRLGEERKRAWEKAAARDHRTLAAFIKARCDEAAGYSGPAKRANAAPGLTVEHGGALGDKPT